MIAVSVSCAWYYYYPRYHYRPAYTPVRYNYNSCNYYYYYYPSYYNRYCRYNSYATNYYRSNAVKPSNNFYYDR